MSNSSLVVHTKISPNRTSPRNHAIDTITIHCVVGQVTAERLGEIFAPESKKASSNYGVDKDGRIGMYVEEKDRSWCSSNSKNDNRAITIEVASDTTKPYAVTDKAFESLIQLCVDICKRNSIKKLVWSTNKDERVNHLNGCNMTVHRDYANKSCPGDYLYNRHGEIAERVNAILSKDTAKEEVKPETPAITNVEEFIWNFLMSWLNNSYAVAGIMGNLYAECSLKCNNLQNTGNTKLGVTDEQYTAQVDADQYTNFVKDGFGYGLAQWTYWSRKQSLLNYAKSQKCSIGDLTMQLNFLKKELTESYSKLTQQLKAATSVMEASNLILFNYERPANQGTSVQNKRAKYGQQYYDKYVKQSEPVKPTTVTEKKASEYASYFNKNVKGRYVVTASFLNIRHGAGSSKYKVLGSVPKGIVVNNYGYYSVDSDGTRWLYIQVTYKGVKYTGFCSSKYLKKI